MREAMGGMAPVPVQEREGPFASPPSVVSVSQVGIASNLGRDFTPERLGKIVAHPGEFDVPCVDDSLGRHPPAASGNVSEQAGQRATGRPPPRRTSPPRSPMAGIRTSPQCWQSRRPSAGIIRTSSTGS